MGFLSRLFGGSERIKLEDVPSDAQQQDVIDAKEQMQETQQSSTQQPTEASPFFDQETK